MNARSESDVAIEVRGLGVRFGKQRVLAGLDLAVRRGSVTALLGRNGCGKSTLLRVLTGQLAPDSGSARVLGLDPAREGPAVRARTGYVPERIELPSWMRARDWLAFLAPFYASWSADEERRLLQLFELEPAERVAALSRGNRAKLALIGALAHRPELLLLDEPFSGLDVAVRRAIATAVIGHLREEGRTVLLVSHSIADVERLADRVAILSQGRIEREGELEDVARVAGGGLDLEGTLRELAPVASQFEEVR